MSDSPDPSDSSISEDDVRTRSSRRQKPKKMSAKIADSLLDSNGETDDEEVEKLQKIIQEQSKMLNEEKVNCTKVSFTFSRIKWSRINQSNNN